MIQIIENLLEDGDLQSIQNLLLGEDFPWFFYPYIIYEDEEFEISNYQLVHTFYKDKVEGYQTIHSTYFNILNPIIEKLNSRVMIRIKANLRPAALSHSKPRYHTDIDVMKGTTAIFYVNSNNGYTLFKDTQQKVESVENRLVIFPTPTKHSGIICTDQPSRVVINFNYISKNV